MSNWMKNLVPAAALAALVACGGGGGGGGGSATEADKNFPTAAASATFAASSVTEVNGLIEEIRQADVSGNVGGLPMGAMITGPATGTTSSGSLNCSQLGTNGSGTVNYTFNYTDNRLVSMAATYHDCQYTSAGTTIKLNGKYSFKYTAYTDETHYTLAYSFNLTYDYTGPSFNDSGTLKTAQSCTQNGGEYECHFQINDGYLLDDYDVSSTSTTITVHTASITTANATIVISNWVYNTTTGRASSGTINVTYANGDHVTITATGSGYTVVVTIGGNASTYNVAY
jgi:hypothetical protein